ncbi:ATP phosphoribosyltransferase [Caulobacter sp. S45]|uniref:ATP phosphoribosyltransferase n=1 Tax=Caulobacter sp. S45 TaxID=1641861 RepID=UPI00131E6AAA|nr:ATP phosphoribosyltransferase [Caulobacter sp. S45]
MSEPLIFAIPSKGRLKEQVDGWLTDCGFTLETDGGERGYRARLRGLPQVDVRLMSASDIAAALDAGDIHLGVTGEDLLRESGSLTDDPHTDDRVMLLRALGFGRADLVVAAPQSWIDVEVMADLEEVAHLYLARTGGRLRVATKYAVQTRAFFAAKGVADYRIVESGGATEGAPAAGLAELVVDITTTGATLAANNLKIISDGVILKSQAQLAASLRAPWTAGQLGSVRRLVSTAEARARARKLASLRWPPEADTVAEAAVAPWLTAGATRRTDGLLAPESALFDLAAALAEAGVGPVSVTRPDYVFEAVCAVVDRLAERVSHRA